MKKIIIASFITLAIFLSGCARNTSRTLPTPVTPTPKTSQPEPSTNTATQQTSENNKSTLIKNSLPNQASKTTADSPGTNTTQASTCTNSSTCDGADKIECLKDWLKKSKCFSDTFINEHFSNFRMGKVTDATNSVYFDFKYNNYLVNNQARNYAVIEGVPSNFWVRKYFGPLKEYQINITREAAFQKIMDEPFCKSTTQDGIASLQLKNDDVFEDDSPDDQGYDKNNLKYDYYGIYWGSHFSCGNSCWVDASTGQLYGGTGSCEP